MVATFFAIFSIYLLYMIIIKYLVLNILYNYNNQIIRHDTQFT